MIEFEGVSKIYRTRRGEIKALDQVDLRIGEGEFVVVRGPSGCGKTSLLLGAGAMLRPSRGRIVLAGQDVYALSAKARATLRRDRIGFVFQIFHLVPYLNVLENVLMGSGSGLNGQKREAALQWLERLGIAGREEHLPNELSAGERQRTAIARALLSGPRLLLADEPTGNLDPENARDVMARLSEFHAEGGTVVVVTHGAAADAYATRIVRLSEGRVLGEDAH